MRGVLASCLSPEAQNNLKWAVITQRSENSWGNMLMVQMFALMQAQGRNLHMSFKMCTASIAQWPDLGKIWCSLMYLALRTLHCSVDQHV